MELGLKLALGSDYKCLGYCEREAYAARVLVARMEDKTLDDAPIWDDLKSFPSSLFRGKVDLISAGFPCQPWSVAGQRKGIDDERWLWPAIADIIREVGPRIVFLENVPGLLNGGAGPVFGELASLGFDSEWGIFSASEVGAPHKRERVFILAYAPSGGLGGSRRKSNDPDSKETSGGGEDLANAEGTRREGSNSERVGRAEERSQPRPHGDTKALAHAGRGTTGRTQYEARTGGGEADAENRGEELGDPEGERLRKTGDFGSGSKKRPSGGSSEMAHAESRGLGVGGESSRGDGLSNRSDKELAHADGEGLGRRRIAEDGLPSREGQDMGDPSREGLQESDEPERGEGATQGSGGLDDGPQRSSFPFPPGPGDSDGWTRYSGPKPALRRGSHGLAYRVDRLRAAGNGVVPLEAAYAFRTLAARLDA